jgi:predicted PurR-regulated permease PerM
MNQTDVPDASAIGEPRRQPLAVLVFAALAIAILLATFKILFPYLTPIILALVVVTFTYRTYERVARRLKGRSGLAAVVMILVVCFTIILPLVIVGTMLVEQAAALFKVLQQTDMPALLKGLRVGERLMFVKKIVPSFDPATIAPEKYLFAAVKQIPAWVAANGSAVFASVAQTVLAFFLMLLAMYYFYVDGRRLTTELVYLSPLPDEYDKEIFARFRGVIDATFRGQILTALAQGAVTGIGLGIAGVPAPVFWGAMAALFALIPMVGPALIWIPAAGYLFVTGQMGWGIFMVLWGVVAVGLVDNVIRPWAMKEGLNLPAVVLIFAILGGMQAFGFVGLVIGPLVFALLVTILQMYKTFFARSLKMQNKVP